MANLESFMKARPVQKSAKAKKRSRKPKLTQEFICRPPGAKSRAIIERDKKAISQSVTREFDFVFKSAKGCHIWDEDGRKYLDFSAAVAVANAGHNNPEVLKAIRSQLKYGTHAAFTDFYSRLPLEYAEYLLSLMPYPSLNNAFLSNSGTEAIECAYKAARWHTNKKWVIAFKNAFHGRTMGSLSMTNSKPVQRERFDPFLPVRHTEFPYFYRTGEEPEACSRRCLSQLEETMLLCGNDLAAVFLEPIQGEGGYIVPPKSFLKGVRKLCDEHNVLLAVDEIQSGCFRTGKFLASENFEAKPDIVAMAKGIGGGLPLGATVASKQVFDWPPGSHASTFGGNLASCAAGLAALKYMRNNRLGENAKRVGEYMLKRLREIQAKNPIIGDVRGLGLMIGVEFSKSPAEPAAKERDAVICNSVSRGLVLLPAGQSVIRFCPPLTITKAQAEFGLRIFEDAVKSIK